MAPKANLDRTDFDILAALQKDARLSNKELAARLAIAPSTCLERVRRLKETGVLRGSHADVAPKSLGIGLQALVAVRIRRHSRPLIEQFHAHVWALPEVMSIYHVAGANDFLVHVVTRDAEHLRSFVLGAFAVRAEVAHMETALVFDHVRKPAFPNLALHEGE